MNNKQTVAEIIGHIRDNWAKWDTPETAVMLGVIRLNDLVMESNKRIQAGFGLSQAGFEVLVTLRAQPMPRRLTPTELYRAILISSGGMTKVVKQLESEGSVIREDNPEDHRSRFVKLTSAGAMRAEAAMEAVSLDEKKLLRAALSEQQIAQLSQVLLHTVDKLEGG